ncbi:hypothetical protein NDU88_002490 [Pleurodeles waltl]|uniref:Uncharacterized protein n=1 Tax=Pleurodeles waltl TaxID=8319 RepID=A0AAV7NFJ7_PLEWA|nr:hypothetical protein NDU88_002490 [Pleurodeles waltl]
MERRSAWAISGPLGLVSGLWVGEEDRAGAVGILRAALWAGRVFFFRGSILQAGGALGELVRQHWGPGYAPVVQLRPVRLLVWGEKVTTPTG